MTENEYLSTGHSPYHCEFTLANNSKITGVVGKFLNAKYPGAYQFVATGQMVEFQPHMNSQNIVEMERLSSPIDLKDIISVERLN